MQRGRFQPCGRSIRLTRRNLVLGGAASLLCAPGIVRGESGLRPIRFASVGGITDAAVYLAEERGYFREAGIGVQMDQMASAPTITAAIATGQVDVAGIAVSPGMYAAAQRGISLRIVGDKQSIRPGFSAISMLLAKRLENDWKRDGFEVLRKRKLAISAKASTAYFMARRFLAAHSLSESDVELVELAYPDMLPALVNGAVDVVHGLEPFSSRIVASGAAMKISDLTEVLPPGGYTLVPLVYSEQFAATRKDAQAFMDGYLRGARDYNDAFGKSIGRDTAVEVIARRAKLPVDLVRSVSPSGLDPDQKVSMRGLEEFQSFFSAQGYLQSETNVASLVDTSFAEDAVRRFGAYQG